MKHYIFIIIIGLLLVSACSSSQVKTEIALEPSNTSLPTKTEKPTNTPPPSSTPVPSQTATHSPTSTISPTRTITPVPAEPPSDQLVYSGSIEEFLCGIEDLGEGFDFLYPDEPLQVSNEDYIKNHENPEFAQEYIELTERDDLWYLHMRYTKFDTTSEDILLGTLGSLNCSVMQHKTLEGAVYAVENPPFYYPDGVSPESSTGELGQQSILEIVDSNSRIYFLYPNITGFVEITGMDPKDGVEIIQDIAEKMLERIKVKTAIPEPDPEAMLDWQALDLPANFEAYFQESFGIQEGAVAFQGMGDEGAIEFAIEDSFLFGNDVFTDFIYGYTINLAGEYEIEAFDDIIDNSANIMRTTTAEGILARDVMILEDVDQIGDHSQAISAIFPLEDRTDRLDNIDFRKGDIGVSVFVRYLDGSEPAVSVEELAKVHEQSIQTGFQSCKIVNVTPVTDAQYPTFVIEAKGFYPVERRTIILTGEYKIDGEIKSAATALMGQSDDADLTTKEGKIKAEIALVIEGLEGDVEILDEFEITVQGQYSGCEVKRKVTWTGE